MNRGPRSGIYSARATSRPAIALPAGAAHLSKKEEKHSKEPAPRRRRSLLGDDCETLSLDAKRQPGRRLIESSRKGDAVARRSAFPARSPTTRLSLLLPHRTRRQIGETVDTRFENSSITARLQRKHPSPSRKYRFSTKEPIIKTASPNQSISHHVHRDRFRSTRKDSPSSRIEPERRRSRPSERRKPFPKKKKSSRIARRREDSSRGHLRKSIRSRGHLRKRHSVSSNGAEQATQSPVGVPKGRPARPPTTETLSGPNPSLENGNRTEARALWRLTSTVSTTFWSF